MPPRGKFIVLEGIDGSGKRTQMEMLARALAERGIAFTKVSFPRYEGVFGKLVARYLNGDFGSLDTVDAHFSALLYAGDRFESKSGIERDLAAGNFVLADRYIGSNLAHQGARVAREQRPEFLEWLKHLEYNVYGLPSEDLVIYLRIPVSEAHRLVGQKGEREYTTLRHDIQESDLAHLQGASEIYDRLAQQPNWVTVECYDAAARSLRSRDEIHQQILAALNSRIFAALPAGR